MLYINHKNFCRTIESIPLIECDTYTDAVSSPPCTSQLMSSCVESVPPEEQNTSKYSFHCLNLSPAGSITLEQTHPPITSAAIISISSSPTVASTTIPATTTFREPPHVTPDNTSSACDMKDLLPSRYAFIIENYVINIVLI